MRAACRAALLFALLPRGAGFLQMYQRRAPRTRWGGCGRTVPWRRKPPLAAALVAVLITLGNRRACGRAARRGRPAAVRRARGALRGGHQGRDQSSRAPSCMRRCGAPRALGSAHRAISFVDVTETCAAEGLDELCTVADIYFAPMSLQAEFPPSLFPADVTAIMVADGGDKPRQALLRRTNGEVTYGRPFFKNYVLIKDDDPTLCWCVHAARSAAAGAPARPPPRCPPTPTPTVPRWVHGLVLLPRLRRAVGQRAHARARADVVRHRARYPRHPRGARVALPQRDAHGGAPAAHRRVQAAQVQLPQPGAQGAPRVHARRRGRDLQGDPPREALEIERAEPPRRGGGGEGAG